ncbi:glycoside hydrolase family 3 N-terminal domain-containing protein [Jannaschia sp. W003]|uniref:glycoside hydrolase family 3 N-terminal domain-containing protein n=1 Tax=Jannaschia sp. W003 TaxID=2867012 RepID=UPI0021A2FD6B|nr:glycoside hydrolase family 3 N-terminal domain-containing protein [Jannaschia sp. W003]UWQ20833.1 beta-hexosaminidase [Jannaschia sp. W003]
MPGAFILGCEGPALAPGERDFFREADPWGFILFARNVETPDALRALCASLRESVGRDAPILIDQEGGRVQRLGPPFWSAWLPPLDMMDRAADPERAMWLRARLIAHELRASGVDVNCTPTADIAGDRTHRFLRNRTYGRTAAEVIARARANAEGCLAGGVLPVVKHIPGHGRASADSHLTLPRVDASADALRAHDFGVFRALRDLPLGMTAHVVYRDIDPERPGTISPAVIGEIRETIGFDGLLMTDDISMGAMPGTMRERCRAALAAGCDTILHCNGERADMEDVVAVSPALTGEAEARAERALARRTAPEPLDIDAARAELAALIA